MDSTRTRTRQRLKEAAQRLFADQGLNAVTVRDIVAAAGQRNTASLHYYFGSKDALIAELLHDSVRQIDGARIRMLDELDRSGKPIELQQIVRILAAPKLDPENAETVGSTVRFVNMIQNHHRSQYREAMEAVGHVGYRRCIAAVHELLPDIDRELLRERLFLLAFYIQAAFAARERALERAQEGDRFWQSPTNIPNLIDTMVGMLRQPPSEYTLKVLNNSHFQVP